MCVRDKYVHICIVCTMYYVCTCALHIMFNEICTLYVCIQSNGFPFVGWHSLKRQSVKNDQAQNKKVEKKVRKKFEAKKASWR